MHSFLFILLHRCLRCLPCYGRVDGTHWTRARGRLVNSRPNKVYQLQSYVFFPGNCQSVIEIKRRCCIRSFESLSSALDRAGRRASLTTRMTSMAIAPRTATFAAAAASQRASAKQQQQQQDHRRKTATERAAQGGERLQRKRAKANTNKLMVAQPISLLYLHSLCEEIHQI